MVSIGVPDLSTAFLVAAIVPLIIGFIVGLVIKNVLKIGIAIAILIVILIVLGVVSPGQIIQPVLSLVKSGPGLASSAHRLASYLPYSSVSFLIGLAIGFLKG